MKGSLLPIILKVLLCARWVREVRHLLFFHSSFSSLGMWFWLCIKMTKFTCHLGFIIIKFIMKQRWEWSAQVHPGFTVLPLKISHPVKSSCDAKKSRQPWFAVHNNGSFIVTLCWMMQLKCVVIMSINSHLWLCIGSSDNENENSYDTNTRMLQASPVKKVIVIIYGHMYNIYYCIY